ncbi:MAG: transposase [Candidatus Paceibacterota bacterium]
MVDVGAYCLMPNHFHILIYEKSDSNISLYMKKLLTAYVMYFNKKYKRTGSLFEGKFKAQHVDSDRYLKYLFSYIDLNPVKLIQKDWKEVGIKNKIQAYNFALEYRYSSFTEDRKDENKSEIQKIVNITHFPKYFLNFKDLKEEIFEWLMFPRKDLGKERELVWSFGKNLLG